jgi:hypothetical protein
MLGYGRSSNATVTRNGDEITIDFSGAKCASGTPPIEDNAEFVKNALGNPKQIHHLSRTTMATAKDRWQRFPVPTVSLLYQSAHNAFAEHRPYTVSPEVFWYAIVHEVAICIKQNSAKYASLFTDTPNAKQTITVRDDSLVYGQPNDWARCIGLFDQALRERIDPATVDLFLPKLSTMTQEDETAILVNFMDAVSSYYKYEVQTLCGIPSIRVRGTVADWETVGQRLQDLSTRFDELKDYFASLQSIVATIAGTIRSGHADGTFWTSIYKYTDHSGGPAVTGWITALSAYRSTDKGFVLRKEFDWEKLVRNGWGGLRTDSFAPHISKVAFLWKYFDEEIPMAFTSGVLGVECDNGYLTPRLGFGVVEV